MGVRILWGLSQRLHRCVSRRRTRHLRYSACVAAVFLFLLGVSVFHLPDHLPSGPAGEAETPQVTLLIWTRPFGQDHQLPDCRERFQVDGCTLTDDAGAYRRADAVLVHHREVSAGLAELPPEPRPGAQKWIWMNFESPTHSHGLWRLEGLFNLTMSYRADSDIFLPYGYLVPRARTDTGALPLSSSSETPRRLFVAWVVSNWSETHARVSFYYQLSRFIPVDVYGRAGLPLPSGVDHVVQLLSRYQFYLALENSLHTDYVTEKLWNAVRAGAVPVVLGPSRQNYERFLPSEAFIHVDDFPSTRGLARYLLLLRSDPVRMRRHSDWRRSYSLHQADFWSEHYCMACKAVRGARGRTDVVRDLRGWFQS